LFSQPPPVAISENAKYLKKPANRDEDGKVIIAPRNFTTKKIKQGSLDKVLFEKPSYVTVGDNYEKPIEIENLRPNVIDGYKKGGHDVKFKPAKHKIERYYTASYKHMNERVDVKKEYRDADGVVITSPKNFYTTGPKGGETGKLCYFETFPKHMPDDFNYPKKLARQEMEAGKKLE